MNALKRNKKRFRNNLQQFIELKEAGKLNGSAAQIKEKLKGAAKTVDLDFLKEYKAVYKELLWGTAQSDHRENATPGAISGHSSSKTKNKQNSDKRENPCGCQHRHNPETNTVCLDEIDCNVTVQAKTNATKGGIEIRFSDSPPEKITDQLKVHDFWFYTPDGEAPFWAGEITPENKTLAEKIAGKFDSAVLKGRVKNLKDNRKQKTHKNFEKDDLVKFVGLPKEVNGKKNPLVGKGGTVVNSQPFDVDVEIKGYGTVGFKPKNLVTTLQLTEEQQFVDKTKLSADQQPLGSTIEDSLNGDLKYELGAETTVDFKADGSIQKTGDYAIVDISDLQASHNKDCSRNSKHLISRSQPRDRSKEALCAQPTFIAKNLNPASITQGNLAFVGAPVSTDHGQIIQGNGRTISLKIAYDEQPESAKKYRQYLLEHAKEFGLTKKQIKQFDKPVLVRMLPVDNETAIELGNVVDTSQAKMSKIDQAKAYIRNLSENQLLIIGKLIRESSGETIGAIIDDVGMDIIRQLKELDRTELVENSTLTSEGKEFLRSVLVGLVFDNEAHPNALHHYMKLPHTIKAGLERSFGYIIPLIGNKGDIRDTLSQAVEVAAQTYQSDAIDSAKEYASSKDMFAQNNFSRDEVKLAQFLLDADTQKAIRNAFRYYDELLKGRKTLFGTTPPKSKKEAFKIVFIDRARPNPEREAENIIHQTIVHAQRLENFGHDNSADLERLDEILGPDGWKWNDKHTQIIRLNDEIQQPRENPTAKFVYIGLCDKLLIDQGRPKPVTLQGPLAMLTNKEMSKLFIVPMGMMNNFPDEVLDMNADDVYAKWHHFAPDSINYTFNWPSHKQSQPVGTADEIYYISDKVMREADQKGKQHTYHHEFDAGKRSCLKKGNILIITDLKINENGILN